MSDDSGGGSGVLPNSICSDNEVLLTSAGDIVRGWKEYFYDLHNAAITPSIAETESGEEGDDSPITRKEDTEKVTKTPKQLIQCMSTYSRWVEDFKYLEALFTCGGESGAKD